MTIKPHSFSLYFSDTRDVVTYVLNHSLDVVDMVHPHGQIAKIHHSDLIKANSALFELG